MNLEIIKMETRLRYVGDGIKGLTFHGVPYYVTQFPYSADGEMMYVVDYHTDVGWGEDRLTFVGMLSFVLTKKELEENFEIWEEEGE